MTILEILGLLILGIIALAVGKTKKKKWLIAISAIPLLFSLSQLALLLLMAMH